MTQLAGQTALVTGANRGIGREFVRQLLDRGVTKVYAAARDPRTVTADDPRLIPLRLDVTDAGSVARAAELAQDVSVVVNNAGIARVGSVLDADTSALRSELETNLFGPLAVTSAFADRLAQRSGAVINMASIVSWISLAGTYGVSKAAPWSATDSMRLELGPRGVQVVGVHVAYVDTDMSAGADTRQDRPRRRGPPGPGRCREGGRGSLRRRPHPRRPGRPPPADRDPARPVPSHRSGQ